MRDASVIACVIQALLAFYVGVTLALGAKSSARRTLALSELFLGGYAASLSIYYAFPSDVFGDVAATISIFFAGAATLELLGFAIWHARGADVSAPARLPAHVRWIELVVLPTLVVVACLSVVRRDAVNWAASAQLLVVFASLLGSCIAFAVGWARRIPGARGYLFGALLPITPVVLNVLINVGVPIPSDIFRVVRDLTILSFVFVVLTVYLDDGHEPMSLRARLVSGMLMAALSFTMVCGHLVLPIVVVGSNPAEVARGHVGALRLLGAAIVTTLLVVAVAPRVFRSSVLQPLDRIRAAIARAETGESVELVLDRRDELGQVARSFNTMVAALARSRAALRDRIVELESSQREVEVLNEELRRQVAARSRHLAQVLPQVERFEETIGIGSLVDGRYRVEERLGEGAMGVVFGVRRMSDQKALALKTILGGSQDEAIRFTREAEIAATIDHRNIVSVIDVGVHLGTPYFVMERLAGGALSAKGARFGDLPWVLPILRQIAEGLEDLQARGILHRDLKPANVLLDGDTERPVAKISDLGIARSHLADALAATHDVGSGERRIAETAPSALVGTFPYMAPELAQGASAYTALSDVFSFGVLAWEVATGALPYRVPPVFAILAGERLADPPDALEAAPELGALLRRCLSQDVEARPSIADIVEALERLSPIERVAAGGLGA